MDYFKKQLELLQLEREEDKNAYQLLIASSSVADRRAAGMAWYPIAIRDTELGRGDYLTVEAERTTHQDVAHQLRFGVSAALFSNHDPKNDRLEGTITWQSGNRLKLTLRTDELPDWADNGKLGIDLLFDDNSYDEMQSALKEAEIRKDKGNEGHLIKVLLGEKPATFHHELVTYHLPQLNASQQAAVEKIIAANEIAIVHGPPGTGKTTTLVQAIKALWKLEHLPILVAAPSNTAVDLLSERLSAEGLNVLRIGNPARVSAHLMSLTLDARIAEHTSMKEIRALKKQANEFRDMAHKYKRNFGRAEREQRKALFTEARNIMKTVSDTEQYIIDDVIARAQVITTTLVGANHYTVRNLQYKTVVIDEAGQALEPACWIPILKAKKVILAGDHQQLPPTIKSNEAARRGLSTTLLEKCVALHPEAVVMLEEQYRMHATIMGYAAASFYNSQLRAHASVAEHTLFTDDSPLAFIDTAGCGFEEKQDGTSTTNPEEAAFLFKHLGRLAVELDTHYPVDQFPSIAVISPYKQQVTLLKEQLQHAPDLHKYGNRISVNTIDSFQGQERDIVYISMTRSNTENKIGFLADIRRMNVAMTRARKKLVVVGDSGTLSQLPFYANFITYAEQHNAYLSAWEFMD
ncbi:IGHMBP2 family helicase [Chitinophaga parva]|uniref:IGHMBP2 family helicase n=1 Tax=Chitinophaga parva TaxID=2169414 RepID=A0A2T7BCB0_9BACT|nr:AAA domain-containing protein [Chitinophaga parva]PUZ22738.1 IGHMBP2 family helicase [Chitinophaga parva]